MFYTYVLLSLKDNKLYIGYSSNLKQRVLEHQKGNVFATKGRLPMKLLFYEAFVSKEDALRREKYFKTDPDGYLLRFTEVLGERPLIT